MTIQIVDYSNKYEVIREVRGGLRNAVRRFGVESLL